MKKVTDLGKALRHIRVSNDEPMKAMADAIGVSVAFLSAIELGKKSAPQGIIEKIKDAYHLTEEHASDLRNLADFTRRSVVIETENLDEDSQQLAFGFARLVQDSKGFDDLKEGLSDLLKK